MPAKMTVTPDGICDAVQDIIKTYSDELVDKLPGIVKDAAKTTLKSLKKNAESIGGRKYKGSFKSRKERSVSALHETTYTIYSTQYRLAHLLEHGHVIRNRPGGQIYGVTRAFPHWKPAEEAGIEEMSSKIKEAIEG